MILCNWTLSRTRRAKTFTDPGKAEPNPIIWRKMELLIPRTKSGSKTQLWIDSADLCPLPSWQQFSSSRLAFAKTLQWSVDVATHHLISNLMRLVAAGEWQTNRNDFTASYKAKRNGHKANEMAKGWIRPIEMFMVIHSLRWYLPNHIVILWASLQERITIHQIQWVMILQWFHAMLDSSFIKPIRLSCMKGSLFIRFNESWSCNDFTMLDSSFITFRIEPFNSE